MKFPRIYADEQGETHIGVRDVPEHEARVGPPPNPVGQMTETEAVSTLVRLFGPGRDRGAVAQRPAAVHLSSCSPAKARWKPATARPCAWAPASVIYCDDISGKGHVTRSITDVRLAFINRAKA